MSLFLPPGFENRMQKYLDAEWPAFSLAHQKPSPTSIRINPKKNAPVTASKIDWTDFGYYLNERPVFTLDPLFHAGAYYVQEASSMLLEQALKQCADITQPLCVLDLCAAPGGKSTHLLSLLSDDSLLVSNEVIRTRAQVLVENITKWGYPNAVVTNNDPEDFQRIPGFFDVIVVDAPCSGEGLFRKDQSAIHEWSPESTRLCSLRQRRILSDVWPSLKEGGILVYCTCTYNPEENENNLKWLAAEKEAEFVALDLNPQWKIRPVGQGTAIGYQCFPHLVEGEGFFMAMIRKLDTHEEIESTRKLKSGHDKIKARFDPWLSDPESFELVMQSELYIGIPKSQASAIHQVSQHLHVLSKGTALGELKHEKIIPSHALALSTSLNKENIVQWELSRADALAYLRKEPLSAVPEIRGFALITYQHTPLGWANCLSNRVNNLYPANWRIRMNP